MQPASSGAEHVAIDHPWIDASRAPLYVWTFPPRPATRDLEASIAAHAAWRARVDHPVAWVIDLREARGATTAQRRLLADHVAASEAHDARWNRGTAFVVPNALVRATVKAVLWMRHPVFETRIFASFDEALSWAEARLQVSRPITRRPPRPG